jgi:hypothetical protein
MIIETLLAVRNKDLSQLAPEQGVIIFRELLWAEAGVSGIAKSCVSVPGDIYDSDGGIDAEVKDSPSNSKQGLIKAGLTSYQIKTGKSNLNKKTTLRLVLFKGKANELKPEVQKCLDNNGIFTIVHFGWDGANAKVRKAVTDIKKQLAAVDTKYKGARVDVIPQNKLIGFISPYPSLALRVNGKAEGRFRTHFGWSSEAEMKRPFVLAADHSQKIGTIQTELRSNDRPVHIHVVGEPGVGKTRLVLEATKVDDLRPLVIYCDDPAKILASQLMSSLIREDSSFYAVIIVDECDDETRSKLWNKLRHHSPRIKLITIYNESVKVSGVTLIESPSMGKDQIVSIIANYGVPAIEAGRWAEFCGGSPRVAHVVGENLKNNPEDILQSLSTVDVWNRFIASSDSLDSPKVEDRRLVLEHLALFKRFGFGEPVQDEAKAISKLICKVDAGITWPRFNEIVNELRKRKILQGGTTLYITPKLLHIKLWADWWAKYGSDFEMDKFASDLPPKLVDWFLEIFEYARESSEAFRRVRELLGTDGPFNDIQSFKSKREALLFRSLALASPKEALQCLERTMGEASKEQLLGFTAGRREVIYSLEHIALYRELFPGAARLLLKLGEAENETWGNNASGVFRDLFTLGSGRVASTSTPPEERLSVLIEALESRSSEMRKLALAACDRALETEHFVRHGNIEEAGLRKGPEGWTPKTYAEWWNAYGQIWQLLRERLDTLDKDERQSAVNILLHRSRGLILRTSLGDIVIDSLDLLLVKGYADKKAVLKVLIQVLHYDGKQLLSNIRSKLEEFKQRLEGNDFSAQLRRYVGMDMLEDDHDEEGPQAGLGERRINELAQKAAQSKELLTPELEWLATSEAEKGLQFGYQLGLADVNFEFLPVLIEAHQNAAEKTNVYFLSGYFRALFERNQPKWEDELDQILEDLKLRIWIPELTWRSGPITDRAAERVLSLIQRGIVGFEHLRMFAYGSASRNLSEEIFRKWILLLLQKDNRTAISIALDLCQFFYCRKESPYELPEDLGLKLLTHPTLFTKSKKVREAMRDYNWSRMGKWYVRKYPARSLELAKVMLDHFGEVGTIIDDHYESPIEVLDQIAERYPEQVWEEIAKRLGPPTNSKAFHIIQWLRGDEFSRKKGGVLQLIPLRKLWEWVDEDIPKRARYLASMVSKVLFREAGRICLAREVLARYGDRDDVKNEMMANFSAEGWTGPESFHLSGKKEHLLKFKQGETNRNVRRWIDDYIGIIGREIKRARVREEREAF